MRIYDYSAREFDIVIYRDGNEVIAKDGMDRIIAEGTSGIDDVNIINSIIESVDRATIIVKDLNTEAKDSIKIDKDGVAMHFINCYFKLGNNCNKNLIELRGNASIHFQNTVIDGNKKNNNKGNGIYIGNPERNINVRIAGDLVVTNFKENGIYIANQPEVNLNGVFKLATNEKSGIKFEGTVCFHAGIIHSFGNGEDGVSIGSGLNDVHLDKVVSYLNNRSGMYIYSCSEVRIDSLITFANSYGLFIDKPANNIFIDYIHAFSNTPYDGIYIINGAENPYGSLKIVHIRGVAEMNGRSGVRITSEGIDLENISLDVITTSNLGEGIHISMPTGYTLKNSIIKYISNLNISSDVLSGYDTTTVKIISNV